MPLLPLLLLGAVLSTSAQTEDFSLVILPAEPGYQSGGQSFYPSLQVNKAFPNCCGIAGAIDGNIVGAIKGPAYGVKCQLNQISECPGFTLDGIQLHRTNDNDLHFLYWPQGAWGTYKFSVCVDQDAATCNDPPTYAIVEVPLLVCSCGDPVIVGFDGKASHFDDVGEFVMLESADGYKVHSTFAGATAYNGTKEKSWTSSIRLFSPNGDMVSCALPAIVPNTSHMQVTATATSATTMLSATVPSAELAEMSASIVLSEGKEPRTVTGCILTTPKLDIRVDQISGYRQAQLYPDTESWAAPFTWLDTKISVKKPLTGPVTGIIGATYPADKGAEQYPLYSDKSEQAAGMTADMVGEESGQSTHRRSLLSTPSHFMPITSAIAGLVPATQSVRLLD